MPWLDRLRSCQIGDGPGYLKDSVVSAGAQALLGHGPLQEMFGFGSQVTVLANLARSHLRIRVDSLFSPGEPVELDFTGSQAPCSDVGGALWHYRAPQFPIVHRWDINV